MKIKSEFVTNSSSVSYIVCVSPDRVDEFEEFVAEMNELPDASNEGVRVWNKFTTLKELQTYTNGEKELDWASKPFGIRFEYLSEEVYNMCKEVIDKGSYAYELAVDWNAYEEVEPQMKFPHKLCPM